MIKIEYAQLKYKYRYLWLKYVSGINLTRHCAKCLLGEYDERIQPGLHEIENMELTKKSEYFYLCGVTSKWENNLHLAFREKEGSEIIIDNKHIKCRIVNAEEIPISDKYIDHSLVYAKDKAYNTCRNWWFANYINEQKRKMQINF